MDELTEARLSRMFEGHEEDVQDYKEGERGALNYLIGVVMQETGGRAYPTQARQAIEEHFAPNVVEVEVPYDAIPDTDEAYEMFKYVPAVTVTYEWDKNEQTLEPAVVTIDQEDYVL